MRSRIRLTALAVVFALLFVPQTGAAQGWSGSSRKRWGCRRSGSTA